MGTQYSQRMHELVCGSQQFFWKLKKKMNTFQVHQDFFPKCLRQTDGKYWRWWLSDKRHSTLTIILKFARAKGNLPWWLLLLLVSWDTIMSESSDITSSLGTNLLPCLCIASGSPGWFLLFFKWKWHPLHWRNYMLFFCETKSSRTPSITNLSFS